MRNFREYDIYLDSLDIVDKVYKLIKKLPDEEKYGLRSQITRSAVSIPSNIAEGASRESEKEFARFLEISLGSSFELETQLLIANRQSYIENELVDQLIETLKSIQKRLYSFRKTLRTSP